MEDPATRSDMAVAARVRAEAEFTAAAAGQRVLDFLERTGIRPEKSIV
jgi:hypothetical protein